MKKTNWRRNIIVFKLDSVVNWFFVPVGVYVLIWNQDLGLSFTNINLAVSLGLIWTVVLELPSGALADMIGRKRTIMLGRVALFFGYLYFFFSRNFIGIIVQQLLYYTDNALNSGAQSALLYDSLKENGQVESHYKKTEANSFMINTIGMAIGSVIGGGLYIIDPFLPFTIMIGVTLVGILTSFFYQEPAIDSVKFTLHTYVKQNLAGLKHIVSNTHIRAVSLFTILVNIVVYTGLWYLYEPRLAYGGFDPRTLSILVAGTYGIRALGTKLIPFIDQRLKKEHTPIFLTLFQASASALSFIPNRFGAISSVYARKASDGYIRPTLLSLQNDQMESRYRATSLSAISLLYNIAVSIIGLSIGSLMDHQGTANVLGYFSLVGLILVLPSAIHLSRVMKEK